MRGLEATYKPEEISFYETGEVNRLLVDVKGRVILSPESIEAIVKRLLEEIQNGSWELKSF